MIRKPKQMSESMILGGVLILAGGFKMLIPTTAGDRFSPTRRLENIVHYLSLLAFLNLWVRAIASGNFQNALHWLFPLLAFLAGNYVSEWVRAV